MCGGRCFVNFFQQSSAGPLAAGSKLVEDERFIHGLKLAAAVVAYFPFIVVVRFPCLLSRRHPDHHHSTARSEQRFDEFCGVFLLLPHTNTNTLRGWIYIRLENATDLPLLIRPHLRMLRRNGGTLLYLLFDVLPADPKHKKELPSAVHKHTLYNTWTLNIINGSKNILTPLFFSCHTQHTKYTRIRVGGNKHFHFFFCLLLLVALLQFTRFFFFQSGAEKAPSAASAVPAAPPPSRTVSYNPKILRIRRWTSTLSNSH